MKAFQGVEVTDRQSGAKKQFYKFHIMDNCVETIYELKHCTWKAPKGGKEVADPPEQQKMFRNHMLDLMRYLIMEYPHFDEQTTNSPKYFFGGKGWR
jgi:phage terminase large subunit